MKELTKKMIAVQSKLNAPKNQYNKFGNYKYRSCEDIQEALKPLLASEGLLQTITDEIIVSGSRFYVRATVMVFDGENEIAVSALARESENKKGMDDAQITGSTSSYARKYALNGMWNIDDSKDTDTNENKEESNNRAKQTAKLKTPPKSTNKSAPKKEATTDHKVNIKDQFSDKLETIGFTPEMRQAFYIQYASNDTIREKLLNKDKATFMKNVNTFLDKYIVGKIKSDAQLQYFYDDINKESVLLKKCGKIIEFWKTLNQ